MVVILFTVYTLLDVNMNEIEYTTNNVYMMFSYNISLRILTNSIVGVCGYILFEPMLNKN